jgi:hypothetical protein
MVSTRGKPFDLKSLDPVIAKGLEQSIRAGQAKIMAEAKKPHAKMVNGWEVFSSMGSYGRDYLARGGLAY